MKIPHVLIVISNLEFGGAQRQVVELCNSVDPNQLNIHICSLSTYNPLSKSLKDADRRLHIVERKRKWDLSVVLKLYRLIKKLDINIAHAYLFDASIATRLAGIISRSCKVVDSERNSYNRYSKIQTLVLRMTSSLVDMFIANSHAGARFNSKLHDKPLSMYKVISNGVDTDRYHPRCKAQEKERISIGVDEFVIGVFASFKAQKNHLYIIRAFKRVVQKHPNAKLLLVGDSLHNGMGNSYALKQEIVDLVASLDLERNCIFLGNRDDTELLYNACDITALPSLHEGTPNVALESMASGVPVIATDVSDNSRVIPDGKVGYIMPLDNESYFSNRIANLIEDSPTRENFSERSRNWILEEFSNDRLAEKTTKAYCDCLDQRGG